MRIHLQIFTVIMLTSLSALAVTAPAALVPLVASEADYGAEDQEFAFDEGLDNPEAEVVTRPAAAEIQLRSFADVVALAGTHRDRRQPAFGRSPLSRQISTPTRSPGRGKSPRRPLSGTAAAMNAPQAGAATVEAEPARAIALG